MGIEQEPRFVQVKSYSDYRPYFIVEVPDSVDIPDGPVRFEEFERIKGISADLVSRLREIDNILQLARTGVNVEFPLEPPNVTPISKINLAQVKPEDFTPNLYAMTSLLSYLADIRKDIDQLPLQESEDIKLTEEGLALMDSFREKIKMYEDQHDALLTIIQKSLEILKYSNKDKQQSEG